MFNAEMVLYTTSALFASVAAACAVIGYFLYRRCVGSSSWCSALTVSTFSQTPGSSRRIRMDNSLARALLVSRVA